MIGSSTVPHVLLLAGLFLSLQAASDVAHADVVEPPPEDCMDGTVGATGHCRPYCAPVPCSDFCEGKCVELRLCVETIICAGLVDPNEDLSRYEQTSVLGTCDDGSCDRGTCETRSVCSTAVSDPAPDAAVDEPPDDEPLPDDTPSDDTTDADDTTGDDTTGDDTTGDDTTGDDTTGDDIADDAANDDDDAADDDVPPTVGGEENGVEVKGVDDSGNDSGCALNSARPLRDVTPVAALLAAMALGLSWFRRRSRK